MSPPNASPEQRLTQLLLSLFSADELRRLLRHNFPEDLAHSLPGANAAPATLADAATQALKQRNELPALWPALIRERPRRQAEIEAVQALFEPDGDQGPIRILFVLSCPPSQYQIDTAEEIRQIRAELRSARHRDRFTHELITAATYTDLRQALREHKPHILHIACHGTEQAELVLSDGRGGEELIDAPTLVELLDVLKDDLRLIVLNACHSAAITKTFIPGIDLVLGMRGAVADHSAIAFAAVFYESIAAGDTVEAGYRLGINELRRRKAQTNIPELLPLEGPQRQRRFVTA
jgi:hypothetical protein